FSSGDSHATDGLNGSLNHDLRGLLCPVDGDITSCGCGRLRKYLRALLGATEGRRADARCGLTTDTAVLQRSSREISVALGNIVAVKGAGETEGAVMQICEHHCRALGGVAGHLEEATSAVVTITEGHTGPVGG